MSKNTKYYHDKSWSRYRIQIEIDQHLLRARCWQCNWTNEEEMDGGRWEEAEETQRWQQNTVARTNLLTNIIESIVKVRGGSRSFVIVIVLKEGKTKRVFTKTPRTTEGEMVVWGNPKSDSLKTTNTRRRKRWRRSRKQATNKIDDEPNICCLE
jgi:hypothetical protein